VSQILLLAGSIAVALASSSSADWRPLGLVALLAAFAVISVTLYVQVGNQRLSAAFIALVLAMTLLGPAPAVALGLLTILVDAGRTRMPVVMRLNNLATYAVFPLVGGLTARALIGSDIRHLSHASAARSVSFAVIVFAIFAGTNVLNFLLIAVNQRVVTGRPLLVQARTLFLPMVPSEAAAGVLAALIALVYTRIGLPVLIGLAIVLVVFQVLVRALLRSEHRADLQLGVLITLVETLALRDSMIARHAAGVARLARALAAEVGRSEREQELVHTAGLLHDIGIFALPDSILTATRLREDDWQHIRRHPQHGATLVGRLDGYGPVADIILYHHERIDGDGYPAGLIGNEIPLPSRILAVCETYDMLTAPDSYRTPIAPPLAIAELRRVAGRQLDAQLVEAFAAMLERDGLATAIEADADFEAELAFERRARAIAAPVAS
jgi:HD-GYP domain-containing protein (c-di-GMP phosphodiesterase class II)